MEKTEAKGVNLLEEWTGTTRFQILRSRLLEGYKWVIERPTKIQKTTRPDSIRLEAWIPFSKKQKEAEIAEWAEESAKLQATRHNRRTEEKLTEDH